MALRPFKLPADFPLMIELIPPSFQYPENPDWSIQADETESMVDSLNGARRIWPIIRVGQLISPPLRDVLRGYVWEEEGKAVGLTNIMRMGATDRWMIGNVSVLPDYRRRGIARKLVEASMDYAKAHGAKAIVLDVIAGNLPACTLYETLGFERYAGQVNLRREADGAVEPLPLPEGYVYETAAPFDWRPRYELAQRITPDDEKKFVPVEEGRFRTPTVLRPVAGFLEKAQGVRLLRCYVRSAGNRLIVASAGINVRLREGGLNHLTITLDPDHDVLAPYLFHSLLGEIERRSPGRRVECEARRWSESMLAAAYDTGFKKSSEFHSMGFIVP